MQKLATTQYVDYKVYATTKLKNRYGYRIKLIFSDGTEDIQQKGGFTTKRESDSSRNTTLVELHNRTFIVIPKVLVEKYLIYWFEDVMKPKLTYNSYMSYRNIIYNYAIPFFKNLYLDQLNKGHIQRYYNYATEKSKSAAKLSKAVLGTALSYAKTKNLIGNNPTTDVNLPKCIKKEPYKTITINTEQTFSVFQVKTLIEASKSTPIYLHILFAVLMGLRKQEINGLKYSDIDYINRKLHIKRQLGIDMNKSKDEVKEKTYTKQEIKLKTYSSERVLDIPDMVFEAILEERKKYERNRNRRINDRHNPFQDLDYICCSTYGNSRSKTFHHKYYKTLLLENKLPNIRFHDLRHTYTTLLLMNNYNLKAVSQILGHASEIITADVYFDKDKVIIDCTETINSYIKRVIPKFVAKDQEYDCTDIIFKKSILKRYLVVA